jgi:hypothetical protein
MFSEGLQKQNLDFAMLRNMFLFGLVITAILLSGCSKGTEPTSELVPVELTLKGETAGNITFAKSVGQVDSIKIDFAIIVLRWIQFKQNIDTVSELI